MDPQPHYEGPPTVPSVFSRLIDPIGEQQADAFVPNPTVSGTAAPTVSQVCVRDPNTREAPFSAVSREKLLNYKDYKNLRPVVPQRLGLNAHGIYFEPFSRLWSSLRVPFLHLKLRVLVFM